METLLEMRRRAVAFFQGDDDVLPDPAALDIWEHDLGDANATPVKIKDASPGDPIMVRGIKGIFLKKGKKTIRGVEVRLLAWRRAMLGEPVLQLDRIKDIKADHRSTSEDIE